MGLIPPAHDAAAVFVARFVATSSEGARAFSDASRARRWVEVQLDQELDWKEQRDGEEWAASTDRVRARVRRIPLHDPLTLRNRYESAFNGDYSDG